jgi:hypothetical protein
MILKNWTLNRFNHSIQEASIRRQSTISEFVSNCIKFLISSLSCSSHNGIYHDALIYEPEMFVFFRQGPHKFLTRYSGEGIYQCLSLNLGVLPSLIIRYDVATCLLSGHSLHKYDFRFSRWWVWRWPSSGLKRRVDWYKFTKVSEVCTASTIRAMYAYLHGTTTQKTAILAYTNYQSVGSVFSYLPAICRQRPKFQVMSYNK